MQRINFTTLVFDVFVTSVCAHTVRLGKKVDFSKFDCYTDFDSCFDVNSKRNVEK